MLEFKRFYRNILVLNKVFNVFHLKFNVFSFSFSLLLKNFKNKLYTYVYQAKVL